MTKINVRSRLGDFLVAFHLVTRRQIDVCRKELSPGQMLGHALVKAGIFDRNVCEMVAKVQRMYQNTAASLNEKNIAIELDARSFIGDIVVALGIITPGQKQEWLDYQDQQRALGKDPGRLGDLLVTNNVCSHEDRDLAMQVQNWLRGVK